MFQQKTPKFDENEKGFSTVPLVEPEYLTQYLIWGGLSQKQESGNNSCMLVSN